MVNTFKGMTAEEMAALPHEEYVALMDAFLKQNADTFAVDPTYLTRLKLVLQNRTDYPYPEAKSHLAEYIGIFETEGTRPGMFERMDYLGNMLRTNGVIPDERAERSKRWFEEHRGLRTVGEVVSMTNAKALGTLGSDPKD